MKSWTHLAQQLSQEYQIPIDALTTKHNMATPGMNLLNTLSVSQPQFSVKEFKDLSADLGRNDIVVLLDAVDEHQLLKEIKKDVQDR